jgi:bifunctional non-homologous end joining protein LigD
MLGKVFDLASAAAIPGAHVVAIDANGSPVSSVAVTSASGDHQLLLPRYATPTATSLARPSTLRVDAQGEGLVEKRLGSKYSPGRMSPDWIKIKNFEHREVVIGGWITRRDGTHGILVGDRDGDKLAFAGVVDIGIGPKLIEVLETIRQEKSPFTGAAELPRSARFVQPRLIAEVQYLAGSDVLRHRTLRTVRVDGYGVLSWMESCSGGQNAGTG